MRNRFKILLPVLLLMLISCSRAAEPINYGKDQCAHCKMTIMDKRYGAEMVDKKGKIFKFDDMVCMKNYITEKGLRDEGQDFYVSSYMKASAAFLNARTAIYLQHPHFRSPMNGNYAAFANEAEAAKLKDSLKITYLGWDKF